MHRFVLPVLALLALALPTVSCGARQLAPVRDYSKPQRSPETTYREVRRGDTLFSIAWESGLDVHDLAAWNRLSAPYRIHPGQRLRLKPPPATKAASDYRVVAPGDTLYRIADDVGVPVQQLAAWNALSPPYRLSPGQRLRLTAPHTAQPPPSPPAPTTRDTNKTADVSADNVGVEHKAVTAWTWPTEGKLLSHFDNGASKGIDIGGAIGQTIRAAAAGKVVYQGSGLRGYGRLIIIQHNADFLSAYAHCEAIHVKEGDRVTSGQTIAAMGSTGTDRIKLHFEIRRRGVPVNPLDYLPKL